MTMLRVKWIIRFFYTACVVLPDSENESTFRCVVAKAIDFIVLLFLMYLTATDIYLVFIIPSDKSPLGFIISALSGDLCNITIRLIYMTRRKAIFMMFQKLQIVHQKLENGAENKWKEIQILLIIVISSWTVPSALFVKTVRVLMTEGAINKSQTFMFFKNYMPLELASTILILINFFLHQQLYAVPGCFVGICCYSYGILKGIINRSERNLKKKTKLLSFTNSYFSLTRQILDCVVAIEEALSRQLVTLFTYLMCCIFVVLTLLLKSNYKIMFSQLLISHLSIVSVALVAFYSLSFQAVSVHKAAFRIKKLVHKFCSRMPSPKKSKENSLRFLLLVDSDSFSKNVLISGWGMFVMNQNFILQTTGAIISYGAVVSQMGKTVSE